MPWLGEEYFPHYPGEEMGWREVVYGDVDHFAGRCTVRQGETMSFCITHWIPLWGVAAQPRPILANIPCQYCSELLTSKGNQKEHMRKKHKEILEAQRLAHLLPPK